MPSHHQAIRVMATGTFDLLHPGHIYYLEESKKLGDELIVIVSNDAYVTQTKGTPLFNQDSRRHMVAALRYVDRAIVPQEVEPKLFFKTVLAYKPDIITLGYNQDFDEEALRQAFAKHGWDGRIVRIGPSPHGELSSSLIKERIRHLSPG